MKLCHIQARDISEAWFLLLRHILTTGGRRTILRGDLRGAEKLELDFVYVQLQYPSTLPFIPLVPEGIPSPVREEDMMSLTAAIMFDYQLNPKHSYYGHFLVPEIEYAIEQYKELGSDVSEMCLMACDDRNLYIDDPWVMKLVDSRINNNTLEFAVYITGIDIWQGFPMFAAALQQTKEDMAQRIGVQDGELVMVGKAWHLLEHQWELAKAVTKCQLT